MSDIKLEKQNNDMIKIQEDEAMKYKDLRRCIIERNKCCVVRCMEKNKEIF